MDQQVNSDASIEQAKEDTEKAKQSNITYTQSEFDKKVKEQVSSISSKFADYDEVREQLESLRKEKEERELSEKSDLEKQIAMNEKLQQQLDALSGEKTELEKAKIRSEVLADEKFRNLPHVYRNAVVADSDIDTVRESAEKILAQFQNDFQEKRESFGIPNEVKKAVKTEPITLNTLKDSMRSKISQMVK